MTTWLPTAADALSLAILAGLILRLARKVKHMSAATDRLTASSNALAASVDAALVALGNHADDSAKLNAVSDVLDATKAKLDAAVATIPAPPPAA